MYDELIKNLRNYAEVYKLTDNENTLEYPLFIKAADAIEELEAINEKQLLEIAVLAKERKKGKWIHFSKSDECSVCGYDTGKYEAPTWFCPKCGADMRGDA